MVLTEEQEDILNTAEMLMKEEGVQLLKVEACAGSGKTFTLIQLAKRINPETAMYLAYNRAIKEEAEEKFKGTTVKCLTMHGLAWRSVFNQYGLKQGMFSARSIKEKLPFNAKKSIVTILESFFLSSSVDIHEFLTSDKVDTTARDLILKYYESMLNGEIAGGHSFYLKLYHILLSNGTIPTPAVDLLMVDEFGDITDLTIDIFRLINAGLKVAVGDSAQNIYSFTHTINGFKALEGVGVTKRLTQSFRVSKAIAERLESFSNTYFDPDMVFKGREMSESDNGTTHAYIGRNNAGLIDFMHYCKVNGKKFILTRKASQIFSLILTLASLKPGKEVYDQEYKWLERTALEWQTKTRNGATTKNLRAYVGSTQKEDSTVKSALAVLTKYGSDGVFKLFNLAKEYEGYKGDDVVTITTSHSSKGLEYHEVTILPDFNLAIAKTKVKLAALEQERRKGYEKEVEKLQEEFRLYYVACSRCMLRLNNATQL